MFKKILIPLNSSKHAETILPIISMMSGPIQPEIIMVFVVSIPSPKTDPYGLGIVDYQYDKLDQYLIEAKEYLESVREKLLAQNLRVNTITEIGDAAEIICRIVHDEEVDLVAFSEHEKLGISKLFYKSLSSCLQGKLSCDLLIFRRGDSSYDED